MAKNKGKPILLGRLDDETSERNMQAIVKAFSEIGPAALGLETLDVVLAVGDNDVHSPIKRPHGRLVSYQSAASNLFDKGIKAGTEDTWVINASATCTCRFIFTP